MLFLTLCAQVVEIRPNGRQTTTYIHLEVITGTMAAATQGTRTSEAMTLTSFVQNNLRPAR